MKIKSLFLAMAACVGLFSACTNDVVTDELTGNGSGSEKNAYASFSFVMPNSGAGTRATGGVEGDGNEVGSEGENYVTEAYILLYGEDGSLKQLETLDRSKFLPVTTGNITVYSTKEDIPVVAATYNVHVVINPTTDFKALYAKGIDGAITNSRSMAEFNSDIETVDATTGEYCTNKQFMMTNAEIMVPTVVTTSNTEGHAKAITVPVQRLAAKITFLPTAVNNSYPIKDEKNPENELGSVKFDAYKVINTRNGAYNLRRVGTDADDIVIGGKETPTNGAATNYVMEPLWGTKTATVSDELFAANYSRKWNTYVAFRKLDYKDNVASQKPQTLAYCLENTMKEEAQVNGYTTAVVLRAKATLKVASVHGLTKEQIAAETYQGTFYRYMGEFYATKAAIILSENKNWDGEGEGLTSNTLGLKAYLEAQEKVTGEIVNKYLNKLSEADLYNNYGAQSFINGNCYYTVWLRHSDNGKPAEMGKMEFAIVRNNIYKLSVIDVKFLGSFTSGTYGPADPINPTEPDVDPGKPNPEIPGEIVSGEEEPTEPIIPIKPNTPDEKEADTYLNVTINVLDWTIRDNGEHL